MAALELIYYHFFIISLNAVVTGKIIVVDLSNVEDIKNDFKPYKMDDYNNIETPNKDNFQILPQNRKEDAILSMCNRLFRSIYGKQSKISCTYIKHHLNDDSVRKPEFNDRKKNEAPFSHDYFDIGDLSRTSNYHHMGFSQDYFDIGDYERSLCNGPGNYCDGNRRFRSRNVKPSTESNETQGRNRNRFKVITNKSQKQKPVQKSSDEDDYNSDDTEYNDSNNHDKSDEESGVKKLDSSDETEDDPKYKQYDTKDSQENESLQNSDTSKETDEVTSKHKNNGEKYIILQGNKFYDPNHFRRRLAYFLPKRIRWEPEDLEKLNYFWFNAPNREFSRS